MKKKRKKITNLAESNAGSYPQRLKTLWENAVKMDRPKAAANELLLYDRIGVDWYEGGLTHQFVTDWLAALPAGTSELCIRINSPGGDVFEGIGIYNALVTWQAAVDGRYICVKIDALAASIASVIAMAGDEICIAGNAMLMIHRASTITWGNAADHRSSATVLEQIDQTIVDTYEARTNQKPEDLKAWLDAETYMTATEAVARGFADKKEDLKSKPAPIPDPAPAPDAPDNQSVSRLAAAQLLMVQSRQKSISAHIASRKN
jgi:ATP-dependent protease ClpP protease subunit